MGIQRSQLFSTPKKGGNKTVSLGFLPVCLKIFTIDNLCHWTVAVCHTHKDRKNSSHSQLKDWIKTNDSSAEVISDYVHFLTTGVCLTKVYTNNIKEMKKIKFKLGCIISRSNSKGG